MTIYGKSISLKWVKVAGTTFYTLPESALSQPVFSGTYLRDQEIPAQAYFGLVEPEPENAYDPEAVRVSIGLADGTYAPIGHLPQTEPDRKSIKAPKKVLVFILDYTVIQPSYHKGYRVFGLTTDPDLLGMTGLAFLYHLNHPYPRSRKGDLVERFPGHDIVELI